MGEVAAAPGRVLPPLSHAHSGTLLHSCRALPDSCGAAAAAADELADSAAGGG